MNQYRSISLLLTHIKHTFDYSISIKQENNIKDFLSNGKWYTLWLAVSLVSRALVPWTPNSEPIRSI